MERSGVGREKRHSQPCEDSTHLHVVLRQTAIDPFVNDLGDPVLTKPRPQVNFVVSLGNISDIRRW